MGLSPFIPFFGKRNRSRHITIAATKGAPICFSLIIQTNKTFHSVILFKGIGYIIIVLVVCIIGAKPHQPYISVAWIQRITGNVIIIILLNSFPVSRIDISIVCRSQWIIIVTLQMSISHGQLMGIIEIIINTGIKRIISIPCLFPGMILSSHSIFIV